VRRDHWGYAEGEALSVPDLIKERYRGIRPAPGYPAQPDHTEKRTIFELLGASGAIDVTLTETGAMWPPPSVCGLYFGHTAARYFAVGPLGLDQVADYAKRKGGALDEARRWLSSNLGGSITG
jgi:5-methyltetrahydrofolate--homocysteine methyltransferase